MAGTKGYKEQLVKLPKKPKMPKASNRTISVMNKYYEKVRLYEEKKKAAIKLSDEIHKTK